MGDTMKGMKAVTVGVVSALAMLVAVLPVGSASAAKTLTLKIGEAPAANGGPADVGVLIEECIVFSKGTLSGNATTKVKSNATENAMAECPEGESISGTITEAALSPTGKATLKGVLNVTLPGPCEYVFKKFKTHFAIPGGVNFEGSSLGKLNKKTSSKTCATTSGPQEWLGDVAPEPFGEPFQA